MKKTLRCMVIFLFVIGCFPWLTVGGSADASEKIVSKPIGKPALDIESVIESMVTKEIVEWNYAGFGIEGPETFTYDTSVYLLSYGVTTTYWERVTTFDYQGITEEIDYKYPTIFIPVFGNIADTKGEVSQRVIGYVRLAYEAFTKNYGFSMALYNLSSENYKDKKVVGSYENVMNYIAQTETREEQIFLIRYPTSFSDDMETVAVLQSETGTEILDISNTCKIPTYHKTDPPVAYSIEEYRTLRMKAEETLYQPGTGPIFVPKKNSKPGLEVILPCAAAGILLAECGLLLFGRHKRKKYRK